MAGIRTVRQAEAFTATGNGTAVSLKRGRVSVLIQGGVGTVSIQRSLDGGATYHILDYDRAGTPATYTTSSNVGVNAVFEVGADDELWRLTCSAYTSGTISGMIAQ